jgi:hypothetical protein
VQRVDDTALVDASMETKEVSMFKRSRDSDTDQETEDDLARRTILLSGALLFAAAVLGSAPMLTPTVAAAQDKPAPAAGAQPNSW